MSRIQANFVLLFVAMIWGSGFVVQQVGTGELGTISFTGVRFLLGALVISPLAWRQYFQDANKRVFSVRTWLLLALVGLVLLTAAALQQYGIFHTTVTNSGFLTGLYVPLVPLIGLFFLGKRVHMTVWPASLCCFCGIWLLSGGGQIAWVRGDVWVIASSFFWALHVLLVGFAAQRTQMPLVVACCQFAVCGLLGLVAGVLLEDANITYFVDAWKGVCYSGIFSVGVAFTLQVVGQRYTPGADAAILLSAEAIFASLCGILFLGERLELVQLAGAILIFLSILAVELLPILQKSAKELRRK